MSSAFVQAAVILLREGLEAMLVIAALAGYLSKVGADHRIRALYGGALAAIGASIIAAWLFAVLNSGEHSDILEGVIILFAAGLMLYVSGWLMVKQDPRGWNEYLAHKAETALAQDTVWAVGALAFLAVFREAPRPCCSSTLWRPPKAAGAQACLPASESPLSDLRCCSISST
nr:FTR1 family protein [Bradyrhizobium sp. BRP22]